MRGVEKGRSVTHGFAENLVRGIEEEGHDTGGGVNLRIPEAAFTFLFHSVGAGIAVLVGKAEKAALGIEEREINPPGVNSQGGDIVTILQPGQDTDWSSARLRNHRISLELMLTPALRGLNEHLQHQGDILRKCREHFETGRLRIHLAESFPLAAANEAHSFLKQQAPTGKVALLID